MLANRVRETTTTTGTGTVDLGGAVSGYTTFVDGIGDGNTCYYVIEDPSSGDWEIGIGTVTDASPDTLARTTIIESTNADAAVNFAAGTKNVWVDVAATTNNALAANDIESSDDLKIWLPANKTITWNQPTWDDQQVVIGATKLAGVSDPTWTAYKGSYVLSFAKNADNILYFTAQLTHKYQEGEDILFHIHTAHADADAGNSRWHLTASAASVNEDFPAETTYSVTHASPSDADKHEAFTIGTISGTGLKISDVLLCSLQREGTDAVNDTYDDWIHLVAADFHVPCDTPGSRQEFSKT